MPRIYQPRLLADGTPNPAYVKRERCYSKTLPDGTPNPHYRKGVYKPAPYQPKLLDDGTPNPRYVKSKPKPYQRKKLGDGTDNPKYRLKSKWLQGNFCAIDGEGVTLDDGRHVYNMIAAKCGEDEFFMSRGQGLPTHAILEFLWRVKESLPAKTIFTIFGGSYDANMWLRNVTIEQLREIKDSDGKYFVNIGNNFSVRYVARKYFAIKRIGCKGAMVVWDVHGFFQQSFLKAIENWLPGHTHFDKIKIGKENRSEFTHEDLDKVRDYCFAELDCLIEIMDKLRQGVRDCGLSLQRFDGAGAVAAAIYKAHDVKRDLEQPPQEVVEAGEHAFFGGRIEIGKYGRHDGTIYHYDINSAYPSVQVDLPSLADGKWTHVKGHIDILNRPEQIILSRVIWSNIDEVFCPFPYRSDLQNKVLFPSSGQNWVFKPELEAAVRVMQEQNKDWHLGIIESWIFTPHDSSARPFDFIAKYYGVRQELVAQSKRTKIPNGQEKIIKLGCNSLYGKTVQKVGYDEKTGRKPPYHNIIIGGMITATTRAKLWQAAMQAPDKIIAMATDGIYSQAPLVLDCPEEKILGAWEAQTHDEMILVQAGFYFLRDGDKWKSYSRGFDKLVNQKDIIRFKDDILKGYKRGLAGDYFPCTRFITFKTALISKTWFDRWCSWHVMGSDTDKPGRFLKYTPMGTKRDSCDMTNGKPHLSMVDTTPLENLSGLKMSAKYTTPWDNDYSDEDKEIDAEHADLLI